MLTELLLVNRIRLFLSYKNIQVPTKLNKMQLVKCKEVCNILEQSSTQFNQNQVFLINAYAYYYVDIFNEKNLNGIRLRVSEFLDKFNYQHLPRYSNDVLEYVYIVEEVWNKLHRYSSKDYTFSTRKLLSSFQIRILSNTFFKHTNNYPEFCKIAKFVLENRMNYPQIHGMNEFFIHLPIVKEKSGEYCIFQYTDISNSLDKYYNIVYGRIEREKRFDRFKDSIPHTKESFREVYKSELWAKDELLKYLEEKVGKRNPSVQVIGEANVEG